MAKKLTTQNLGDNQVTYAKVQQVAANKLLGNATGSTANVAEIPLGANMSFVAGALTATGGGAPNPSTNANNANTTFTYTSPDQLACLPTAPRIYTLDSSFTAGNTINFTSLATDWANYITINADDGSLICYLPPRGTVKITCRYTNATASSGWILQDRQSKPAVYSPTVTNLGTTSAITCYAYMSGSELIGEINVTSGTVPSALPSVTIPSPFVMDGTNLVANTTSTYGSMAGRYGSDIASSNAGNIVTAFSTSTSNLYFSAVQNNPYAGGITPTNGQNIFANADPIALLYKVPVTF